MFKLAVIGNPIAHSLSPEIYQGFAKQYGIEISYEKFLCDEKDFSNLILENRNQWFGVNITAPFKTKAFELASEHSKRALQARSVNTITFRDGKIFGDNTDGVGFIRDVEHNLHFDLNNKSILILGAGGAVRGILSDILEKSPKYLHVFNRNFEKAYAIQEQFSAEKKIIAIDEKKLTHHHYDLIINAIPATTFSEKFLENIPLHKNTFCYDLNYQLQGDTPFMKWTRTHHCENTYSGYGMLVEQAHESFLGWFKV